METTRKKFNLADKVLIRTEPTGDWLHGAYWGFDLNEKVHMVELYRRHDAFKRVKDEYIIPYEGNEHLKGWNEHEVFVDLKEEEWVMVNGAHSLNPCAWSLYIFLAATESGFKVLNTHRTKNLDLAITCSSVVRFKDFNPSDMEATRRKILCVKNGKVITYDSK